MSGSKDGGGHGWVDPDDAPELTDAFFEAAVYEKDGVEIAKPRVGRPRVSSPKVHTRLRIDPDVLEHYRAGGAGWQTRINAALRKAAGLS